LGLGTTLHCKPFQCWNWLMKPVCRGVRLYPTAHTSSEDTMTTLEKEMVLVLEIMCHELPSHCSIRLRSARPSVVLPPTAQAADCDTAPTAFSVVEAYCVWFGLGTVRHVAQGTGVGVGAVDVAVGLGVAVGVGPVCVPAPHAATTSASPTVNAATPRRTHWTPWWEDANVRSGICLIPSSATQDVSQASLQITGPGMPHTCSSCVSSDAVTLHRE
jgi:hypothetical protein